jgi:hypothetical protein
MLRKELVREEEVVIARHTVVRPRYCHGQRRDRRSRQFRALEPVNTAREEKMGRYLL